MVEIPWEHPIFNQKYKFSQGLPKIHEHDAKRPQALGIVKEGRLVVLFTLETDLGDGWEDPEVHNDPENRPLLLWRAHANNLYTNWLNYYVYQMTPYDLYGTPDFSSISRD